MNETLLQALEALPHGKEFRFVDALVSLDPGRSGVGTYRLPSEAEFLRGHFPGDPILPGVLMVEAVVLVRFISWAILRSPREAKVVGTLEVI